MMTLNEARERLEALESKADWDGIIALMQDDESLYADPRYAALMFDEAIYLCSEAYGPDYGDGLRSEKYQREYSEVGEKLYLILRDHYSEDAYCLWRLGECLNGGPGYCLFLYNELVGSKGDWSDMALVYLEKSLKIKDSKLVQMEYNEARYFYDINVRKINEPDYRYLTKKERLEAEQELKALNLSNTWGESMLRDYYEDLIKKSQYEEANRNKDSDG